MSDKKSASSSGSGSSSSADHVVSKPPPTSSFVIPLGLHGRFVLSFLVAIVGTFALLSSSYGSSKSFTDSLVWFWYTDLPPLSGATRIYIYLGLALTAWISPISRPHLGDSPLQAPELFAYTLPIFFSREGLMKLLHSEKWVRSSIINLIRMITLTGFVACILGVGGHLPAILVGLGMFVLHGIVQGCIGTSHRWYVPVYTCFALMFANGNADWSLDAYFAQTYGSAYPFQPICASAATSSILCTGFARKMILMSGISTLFFGFITKILNGGWAWLDGASLSYYVSSEENGRSVILKNLMSKYRGVSLFLSFASIGLEALSVIAVFVPWTRPIIIAKAAGMHLGIWLTMWPNYFPQTVCYALGMSWSLLGVERTIRYVPTETSLYACWIGVGVWLFLSMVALLRIEYWPFTGIPMYSFYRDSSYSYRFLRDASQAQSVAYEHLASGYPNAIAWSNLWVVLQLKNTDPSMTEQREEVDTKTEVEWVNLKSRVTEQEYTQLQHGVYLKQWRRTLHNAAAADMAAKPWGHIEASSSSTVYPGEEWLVKMLPYLRQYAKQCNWQLPEWCERTGALQLRVKLKDRDAVIASIPWNSRKATGKEGVAMAEMTTTAASSTTSSRRSASSKKES